MGQYNSNAAKLGTDSVGRLLLNYSIPSIISMIVVSLYNIIDRIFIGQGVGAMAISGLAITFPLMTLVSAIGTLVGVGAATRMSIVLGMKDMPWARNILGNAFFLTFIMSIILIIPSLTFLDTIIVWFGGREETIPYARDYLRIVIPGSIFTNLSFSFSGLMRASGYPIKSMITILIGVVLNAILDPIFIFGMDMGIRGAAIATVISMFISSVFVMFHFFNKSSYVHFELRAFILKKRIIRNIVSIGMSPFLMNLAGAMIIIILNNMLVKNGGNLAVGAFGIINSYSMLAVMCVMGLCQGMQPIMGYNYGAKKLKRMKDTLKITIKSAIVIMSVGFIFGELFPRTLVSLFTNDEELIRLTVHGLRIVFILFPVIGFQIVVTNFFQSIGRIKQSIFMSLSRQFLLLIPFMYLFSYFWGLTGVWISLPVADFFSFLIAWKFLEGSKKIFYPKLN
ncbi:MAG: MATE family efflux transporter [Rikenellaceae bacterium]|nr:MATE family efflux transporter [Rikenellaceae bacterium]